MGDATAGRGPAAEPPAGGAPSSGDTGGAGWPVSQPAAQQAAPERLSAGWILPLLPAGFVFGLIGGFVQEHRLAVGGVEVPWAGLLLIAALVAAVRALSLNLATRKAGVLFFAGWLVATVLLALPNPSGDVVFSADWGTYLYLGGAALLGAAAAAWPIIRLSDPPPGGAPGAGDS